MIEKALSKEIDHVLQIIHSNYEKFKRIFKEKSLNFTVFLLSRYFSLSHIDHQKTKRSTLEFVQVNCHSKEDINANEIRTKIYFVVISAIVEFKNSVYNA